MYRGVVYFSNFKDQVLYRQVSPTSTPEAVTDTSKAFRYTDGRFCPQVCYCCNNLHHILTGFFVCRIAAAVVTYMIH